MAKSPVAKKSAQKKPTAGAKKSVGGKKSPSTKKLTAALAKAAASGRGRKDAPLLVAPGAGQFVVLSGDVVGVQTTHGFISLQQVADASGTVGLLFPLTTSASGDLVDLIGKLMEFIQAHADGSIQGFVTCCLSDT